MNSFRHVMLGGTAVCLSFMAGGAADAEILANTPMAKEIVRGNTAGDACNGMQALKATPYDACVTSTQEKNHQKGGDAKGFDAGLYFCAWMAVDQEVRPDNDLLKTDPKAAELKPLAAKYFKLYREAQKKSGFSDEQIMAVTQMNDWIFKPRLAAAERGY